MDTEQIDNKPKQNIVRKSLHGIMLSWAFAFMLCFYAPIEQYSLNRDEFWFDIYDLLPMTLVLLVGMGVVASLLFILLNKIRHKLYGVAVIGGFIAFVATYIQGNFLVGHLPPLDGTPVDWNKYSAGRTESVVLWIAVTGIVLLLCYLWKQERLLKAIQYGCSFMIMMLALSLVGVCIGNRAFRPKLDYVVTSRNLYEMSEDRNFIILVLDALDSRGFSELLETNQEYQVLFEDFTYYPNTMSGYPYTMHAVPYLLSGDWYENDEYFDEYVNRVFGQSELFERLEQENYELGLYESEIDAQDESIYRFINMIDLESKVGSYLKLAKQELKFIGLRYAPFDLKKYCLVKRAGFDEVWEIEQGIYEPFGHDNAAFYEYLKRTPITCTDAHNCFKFIHIEGAHLPFIYDKDMNMINAWEGTYEEMIQASMTVTKDYLEKLKASDVYDNSVIIVMADHGFNGDQIMEGRQCPILLIKGMEEKHSLQISHAPVCHGDMPQAYQRLIDGKLSTEVFDYQEGDIRERRFLLYRYTDEEHMQEYIQTGYASDMSTMLPTGKEYNY